MRHLLISKTDINSKKTTIPKISIHAGIGLKNNFLLNQSS